MKRDAAYPAESRLHRALKRKREGNADGANLEEWQVFDASGMPRGSVRNPVHDELCAAPARGSNNHHLGGPIGSTADRRGVNLLTDAGHPIETYLTAAEEGSVAAQFVLGLAHLEGYCVEKNALAAYYWLRLAEASSRELGHRSRALVEQIGSAGKKHEIEDVEHRISIAVKGNKLLQKQRPDEFIKRSVGSPSLRVAI